MIYTHCSVVDITFQELYPDSKKKKLNYKSFPERSVESNGIVAA